jgi:hypothetical protein
MSDATPTVDAPKPLRFRRTRIGLSVFFGVATVALCMLWVRSYSWYDLWHAAKVGNRHLEFASVPGHLSISFAADPSPTYIASFAAGPTSAYNPREPLWSRPVGDLDSLFKEKSQPFYKRRFPTHFSASNGRLVAPHWAFAIVVVVAALAPWRMLGPRMPGRFSLRTMLVTTTLVAVVLCLGVWLSR